MNELKKMTDILKAREKRLLTVRELADRYGLPVVVLVLNIPGADKYPEWAVGVHKRGIELFLGYSAENGVEIVHTFERKAAAGHEWFAVSDWQPEKLKKICVELEEKAAAGRLYDFDVHCADSGNISRADLGLPPRGCIVCSAMAHGCSRSRKHSVDEVLNVCRQIAAASTVGGSGGSVSKYLSKQNGNYMLS